MSTAVGTVASSGVAEVSAQEKGKATQELEQVDWRQQWYANCTSSVAVPMDKVGKLAGHGILALSGILYTGSTSLLLQALPSKCS